MLISKYCINCMMPLRTVNTSLLNAFSFAVCGLFYPESHLVCKLSVVYQARKLHIERFCVGVNILGPMIITFLLLFSIAGILKVAIYSGLVPENMYSGVCDIIDAYSNPLRYFKVRTKLATYVTLPKEQYKAADQTVRIRWLVCTFVFLQAVVRVYRDEV